MVASWLPIAVAIATSTPLLCERRLVGSGDGLADAACRRGRLVVDRGGRQRSGGLGLVVAGHHDAGSAEVAGRRRLAVAGGDRRCGHTLAGAVCQRLAGRRRRSERGRRGRGSHREQHHLADAVPLEVRVLECPVELGPVERERDRAGVDAGEHRLEV